MGTNEKKTPNYTEIVPRDTISITSNKSGIIFTELNAI